MPNCVGITASGVRCSRSAAAGRCRTHEHILARDGAGQTALDELASIRKNAKGESLLRIATEVATAVVPHFPADPQDVLRRSLMIAIETTVKRAADNWHMARIDALELQFRNAGPLTPVDLTGLLPELEAQVRAWSRTGIAEVRARRHFARLFGDEPLPAPNPEEVAARQQAAQDGRNARRMAREQEHARRVERARLAVDAAAAAQNEARVAAEANAPNAEVFADRAAALARVAWRRVHAAGGAAGPLPAAAAPAAPPPRGDLEVFSRDKQNVHTTQSVKMTKEIVARVLKIAVPEEYRWNPRTVSKTPGEIIVECRLRPNSVAQFISRYIASENIYEMGVGIFGKVLDSVWQYIRNSENKEDLCKILAQELRDNEGMCLQGNLTRLCNVLAGYLEGVGPQESQAERLGRELPKLMEIDNEALRMETARGVLRDAGVAEAEWAPWLEALE